ncbi:uncharacterized protein RB166_004308 [Leptodactylus fuscus]
MAQIRSTSGATMWFLHPIGYRFTGQLWKHNDILRLVWRPHGQLHKEAFTMNVTPILPLGLWFELRMYIIPSHEDCFSTVSQELSFNRTTKPHVPHDTMSSLRDLNVLPWPSVSPDFFPICHIWGFFDQLLLNAETFPSWLYNFDVEELRMAEVHQDSLGPPEPEMLIEAALYSGPEMGTLTLTQDLLMGLLNQATASNTRTVAEPHGTGAQQPTQRPQTRQDGGSGRTSSGNAWSRGAPSFASNSNYTGQAFRRRNVVRFRHGGAKEDLPDRRFVVRELLCTQMGFVPTDILAVINLPDRQGYDVSFKLMSDLDRFWANLTRLRDTEGWDKFSFIPISRPDTASVTIVFWNEAVPPQDIVIWLRRHCDLMSDLTKNRDEDGVWTGGWRVLVKLRQQNNITQHLPNSFFIGREKGICFYAGQPRRCFKCGKAGHVASVCSMVKCSLCNEMGHVSATCQNIRCNLCVTNLRSDLVLVVKQLSVAGAVPQLSAA